MARYTYLACDLLTNAVLAELPLREVKYSQVLNGAGSISAKVPMGDPNIWKLGIIAATEPGRIALYVDRDGVLEWGGIIWTRSYDDSTDMLTIGGNEFWSYFRRRRIVDGITYSATDRLTIVEGILNYAQGKRGGNIGVQVPSVTLGSVMDYTAYQYEMREVAQEIETLAGEEPNGFDFAIDVAYDGSGNPAKSLFLGKRRGVTATSSGLMFEKPGNIVKYTWPEDGSAAALAMYAQGAGEGDSMMRSSAVATELLDAGWPLTEDVAPYKDISSQVSLDGHARHDLRRFKYHLTIPVLTVRADQDPVLGSYRVGDEARVRISDHRFQAPTAAVPTDTRVDDYKRIVMIEVTPNDDSNAEQVDLTLGDPYTAS